MLIREFFYKTEASNLFYGVSAGLLIMQRFFKSVVFFLVSLIITIQTFFLNSSFFTIPYVIQNPTVREHLIQFWFETFHATTVHRLPYSINSSGKTHASYVNHINPLRRSSGPADISLNLQNKTLDDGEDDELTKNAILSNCSI